MSEIVVRPLALGSDVEILRLLACDQNLNAELYFGAELAMTVQSVRDSLTDSPVMKHVPWVAVAEETGGSKAIVGKLFIGLPLQTGLDTMTAFVHVVKDYRNRGIGTAFAQIINDGFKLSGRKNLKVFGYADADDAIGMPSSGWGRFAEKIGGLELEGESTTSILTVKDYAPSWPELQMIIDENIGDYKIELWDQGVPQDFLESYAALLRRAAQEDAAPDSGETPSFSPDWVRTLEAQLAVNGFKELISVAFDREGELVGYSTLLYREDGSTLANQVSTFVKEGHRGKKLGMGLKLATHQGVVERVPEISDISVINADSSPYNSYIDDRLGYWSSFKSLIFSREEK